MMSNHLRLRARWRRCRGRLVGEVVQSFIVGVAGFVVAAVASTAARSHVPGVLLAALFLLAILAVAHYGGILYSLPVGIASVLAFDWYFVPPLRTLDRASLLVLGFFLLMAVLVGVVAGRTSRRATAAEQARGLLAQEQAALRRVATLVALQSSASEVFGAVAEEVGLLLRVDETRLLHYDADRTATTVGNWGEPAAGMLVGAQVPLERESVEGSVTALVLDTGRAARIDDFATAKGAAAARARKAGIRSAVATPIFVEGRLWGAMCALSKKGEPLAADAELRIGEFTALVATAIASIEARSDLAASRARMVEAADEERRRVVRDLHDGAQQRLVHTIVTLKMASEALEKEEQDGPALVAEALEQAERATDELRELAHGILPSVLTRGGLHALVEDLASRVLVPVENGVSLERLPPAVEATAYFVVAEALTNVAKHSHADHAAVSARIEAGTLHVEVRDDGVGGAQPGGSGLLGLGDRLAVLDGSLRVESQPNGGTLIAASIPIP
jgi:signal transduction histidine kinase